MADCSVSEQLTTTDTASAHQEPLLDDGLAGGRQSPDPVQGMASLNKTAGPSLDLATPERPPGPVSITSSPPTEARPPSTRELSHPRPATSKLASKPSEPASKSKSAGAHKAESGAPAKPTAVKSLADPQSLVPRTAAPKVRDRSASPAAVRPMPLSPELVPAKGNALVCSTCTVNVPSAAFAILTH